MTVIVPDLHGESGLLDRVLAQFPTRDFVFLGDLVDRGPDSPGVLDRVSSLVLDSRAVLLWGNHEHMMVGGVKYDDEKLFGCWLQNGGLACVTQYQRHPDPNRLTRHVDFIDAHARHWHTVETPNHRLLCSHASRPDLAKLHYRTPEDGYGLFAKSDDHVWRAQNKHSGQRLPPAYTVSVHGHVPQKGGVARTVESQDGPFLLLDMGAGFTSQLAVLDALDMQVHYFS